MGVAAVGRELKRDLALGLRLALPRGQAEALRCAVVVLGVAGCVTVLLFLAALPGAVAARADREFALTPDPVAPSAGWTPLGRWRTGSSSPRSGRSRRRTVPCGAPTSSPPTE